MAYTGPKVLPGLSGQVPQLQAIPTQWDAAWFRDFCVQILSYGDVRNANAGTGIQITGNTGTPAATIALNDEISALQHEPFVLAVAPSDAVLDKYRILTPQSGVLTVTDAGAEADITVGVAANGIGNAQLRQGAALSVIGNASGALANVADIDGHTANTVLLSTGSALEFAAVPLAALAAQATATIVGNNTGGSAAPTALTAAQVKTLLAIAYTDVSGLATVAHSGAYGDLTGTPSIPAGANPSASVGLSVVDGSSSDFMRADGAPALSVAIAPTWTGAHTFTPSSAVVPLTINAAVGAHGFQVNGGLNTAGGSWCGRIFANSSATGFANGLWLTGGTSSGDAALLVENAAANAVFLEIFGDGHGVLGASATAGLQWDSSGNVTFTESLIGTGATGGGKGAGTLNAAGLYVNGTAVATGSIPTGANPSASVGLSVVDGSSSDFMRADGAPALDVTIAPTWTGAHVFAGGATPVELTNSTSGVSISLAVDNSSTTAGDTARLTITAGSENVALFCANQNQAAALVTGGPATPQACLRTLGAIPLVFGTNNTYRGQIDSSGNWVISGGSFGPSSSTTVGFYGKTPIAQRATTTNQHTSLLGTMTTTTGSLFDGANLSSLNQAVRALQEVMNTLAAYGLWGTS